MTEVELELADAELICNQSVDRIVLEPPQIYRRWRPALMRGSYENEFVRKYFDAPASIGSAGYLICKNCTIVLDGLAICDSKLLVGRSMMYPMEIFPFDIHSKAFNCCGGVCRANLPTEHVYFTGTTAVIASPGWQTYGHWIVDLLPRYFRSLEANPDRFLFPGPAHQWMRDMLASYGVDLNKCEFVDLTQIKVVCETAVLPMFDRFNSEIRPAVTECHSKVSASTPQSGKADRERIFISRSSNAARKLKNRTEIENVAERCGFRIVQPETMPFAEQVLLFSTAEVIAGECGSGLHNTVYTPEASRVCVIQSENNHNFLQSQISMHKKHDIFYVIGTEFDESGDYAVCKHEFAVALKAAL